MPNFVTNIVHFQGDPERIVDLRGAVQDDQYGMSGIDFEKIIPMPSGLWMGGINPDTRAKYGKNNWLDWSIANWGTTVIVKREKICDNCKRREAPPSASNSADAGVTLRELLDSLTPAQQKAALVHLADKLADSVRPVVRSG